MYKKLFTREFTLVLAQVWYRGEVVAPRQWIDMKKPNCPYMVFERRPEAIDVYMSAEAMAEIEEELKRRIGAEPDFVQRVIDIFYAQIKDIRPIWEAERALPKSELLNFLQLCQDAWTWYDAIYWICDVLGAANDPRFKSVINVRKDVEDLGVSADIVIEKSLEQIFPSFADYIDVISYEELVSGNLPDKEVLEKRQQGFIYIDDKLLVDVSLEEIEEQYNIEIERRVVDPNIKEFSGQSACNGLAKGVVRRIMGFSKVHTMKEGEILVTGMTIPNFLPAMKKAAAIITDEGGITCHAAIVARELGKPCIIGTKIATQVLKDGDEVEVDAENGVVRIIKK